MPTAPKIVPLKPRYTRPPRGTTAERGYGSAHERQRERLLKERPICERCGDAWSHHLHHRDRDPFHRSDANAEMLCAGCHRTEHGGR